MHKRNIIVIIANTSKSLSFEWTSEFLCENFTNVDFILINSKITDLENYLIERRFNVLRINFVNKFSSIFVLLKLIYEFVKRKPDIVHCHIFEANILGLIAAKICGIKKRIYTRHHSTLNFDYHPSGIKYDKLCNYLATDIIAISNVVKMVLTKKEGVSESKISLIPHGINISIFNNVNKKHIDNLYAKYKLKKDVLVIGVIARYLKLKGLKYIIEAFHKILIERPNSILILANATGGDSIEIKNNLNKLPQNSFIEIAFENDLMALYKLFDVYVHVPIDESCEAFGQTYVEALVAGKYFVSYVEESLKKELFPECPIKMADVNTLEKVLIEIIEEILKGKKPFMCDLQRNWVKKYHTIENMNEVLLKAWHL